MIRSSNKRRRGFLARAVYLAVTLALVANVLAPVATDASTVTVTVSPEWLGKIVVQKQYDSNGDGTADYTGSTPHAFLAGWTFTANGASQTTSETGRVEFELSDGSYSLAEGALKPDTRFLGGSCQKDGSPVGTLNAATRTISGLPVSSETTIHCTFLNGVKPAENGIIKLYKKVEGGTAQPSDWMMHVKSGGSDIPGSPQAGSASGTNYHVPAGTYQIAETGGPANYVAHYSASCEGGNLTVSNGQTVTCTVTNKLKEEPRECKLWVEKKVDTTQAAPHDTLTYTINYRNNGTADCGGTGLKVYDVLSPGLEYIAGSARFASVTGDGTGDPAPEIISSFAGTGSDNYLANLWEVEPNEAGTIELRAKVLPGEQCKTWDVWNSGSTDGNVAGSDVSFNSPKTTVTGECEKNTIVVRKEVIDAHDGDIDDNHLFSVTLNNANAKQISESQDAVYGDLTDGTYTVTEQAAAGYDLMSYSYDENPLMPGAQVSVANNKTMIVNVLNKKHADEDKGKISGYKYHDKDANGQRDHGEEGLGGWEIKLFQKHNDTYNLIATDSTNADGGYAFTSLPEGTYRVSEVVKPGWRVTAPASGSYTDLALKQDQHLSGKDFGNFQLGKISGKKLDDHGKPLNNWEICLAQDPKTDEKKSGDRYCVKTGQGEWSDGSYEFVGLERGTYVVTETMQEGWHVVSPEHGTYTINVESGTGCEAKPHSYDFVNKKQDEKKTIVELTKTDTPDPVMPGNEITYTINWSVTGNAPATDLVLTDQVPEHTGFVSASEGGTLTDRTVTWNLGTQEPGATGTVTFIVKVDETTAAGTVIINTAVIDAVEIDPVQARAETTVAGEPVLKITKTVDPQTAMPGDTVTYTVTIMNEGQAPAIELMLTDTLPEHFSIVETGAGENTWSLGTLNPGQAVSVSYQARIDEQATAGNYENLAVAMAKNHGQVTARATVEVHVPEHQAPKLTVDKSVEQAFVNPGGTATYHVTVTNTGDAAAVNVRVMDALPSGFTFDDGHATKTWELGGLQPGEHKTITYTAHVGDHVGAGKYENLVTAWADNHPKITDSTTIEVRLVQVHAEEVTEVVTTKALPTTGGGSLYLLFAGLLGAFIIGLRYLFQVLHRAHYPPIYIEYHW